MTDDDDWRARRVAELLGPSAPHGRSMAEAGPIAPVRRIEPFAREPARGTAFVPIAMGGRSRMWWLVTALIIAQSVAIVWLAAGRMQPAAAPDVVAVGAPRAPLASPTS